MPCAFPPRVRTRTETPSDSTGPASILALPHERQVLQKGALSEPAQAQQGRSPDHNTGYLRASGGRDVCVRIPRRKTSRGPRRGAHAALLARASLPTAAFSLRVAAAAAPLLTNSRRSSFRRALSLRAMSAQRCRSIQARALWAS